MGKERTSSISPQILLPLKMNYFPFFTVFFVAKLAWSAPPSPPRRYTASHHQFPEYQAEIDSSEYIPHGFDQMSLIHGNVAAQDHTAPPTSSIHYGYEHLLPHLLPELNPGEFHPTEHRNLMPNYSHDEQNLRYFEGHAPYHHVDVQHEAEGSNARSRKSKGKQVMRSRQEVGHVASEDGEEFVNMLYHGTDFHGRINNHASDSEEEIFHNDNDPSDGEESAGSEEGERVGEEEDDEGEEEATNTRERRRRGPARQDRSRRDFVEKDQIRFRELWNEKGLSTDMDAEDLAEQVALWRISQDGGFDSRSIGMRAGLLISETKSDNLYPGFRARYSSHMRVINKFVAKVKRQMDKNDHYLQMKQNDKKMYEFVALQEGLRLLHQSQETGIFSTSARSGITGRNSWKIGKIMQILEEHLQAQDTSIDHIDLSNLVEEAFTLNIKGIKPWDIIECIAQYLVEERKIDPDSEAFKIFLRRARLKNSNRHYHEGDKEYWRRSRAARRKQKARASNDPNE